MSDLTGYFSQMGILAASTIVCFIVWWLFVNGDFFNCSCEKLVYAYGSYSQINAFSCNNMLMTNQAGVHDLGVHLKS